MSWHATALTLFPEMFPGTLGHSLAGRALREGKWSLDALQIRDFATDKHRTVDDTPFGGGAGMVMRPDVVDAACAAALADGVARPLVYLTPRGRLLDQALVRELVAGPGIVLVCGRYEGLDQRVIEARGMREVSVGDYVLSGGEPAALVLLDACVRGDERGGGKLLRGWRAPSGIPALHAAGGVGWAGCARCPAFRPPRRGGALAPWHGGGGDARAAAGSLVAPHPGGGSFKLNAFFVEGLNP
jgi:hypothetical protein